MRKRAVPQNRGPKDARATTGRRSTGAPAGPQKNFDRYTALAREAAASGDIVAAEDYYQHAEHYFRLMAEKARAKGRAVEPSASSDDPLPH